MLPPYFLLNKDFCLKFTKYLDDHGLNFNKSDHILSYYNDYPKLSYTNQALCTDEFFFDAYLLSDSSIIQELKNPEVKQEGKEKRLCTNSGAHSYVCTETIHFEDHTLQYFIDKDPLFHHTLIERNTEKSLSVMMRMFSV